jgi:ribonuclease BN (tRNA processing enzyme)
MRLAQAGVLPPMLSAVLVTHLHSDHLTDLNDVITTRWVMSGEPSALPVSGPRGIGEVVDATLGARFRHPLSAGAPRRPDGAAEGGRRRGDAR